jgi:hypothetical protein
MPLGLMDSRRHRVLPRLADATRPRDKMAASIETDGANTRWGRFREPLAAALQILPSC